MKIALVHEFLNQLGGAERVLENFLEIWPEADLHVILYNSKKTKGVFDLYHKKISWLNNFPLAQSHPRLLLVFMPWAIESFDFSEYDLVISDSSSFAKGAKANGKLHICYCHTPTRFLWTDPEYLNYQRYPKLLRLLGSLYMPWLKKWDYKSAARPDFFIANSVNVQNRIKKYYGRDSEVIPPPVDTQVFYPQGERGDYFFSVGRLEPYKKMDVIIETFNESGLPLKIAGTGTVEDKLKSMAKSNIEFLGRVPEKDLRKHYASAKAFVFAAEEDAGIVMLEAMACGTPVIAYGFGGALEVVKPGVTGEFFTEQTSQSLKNVLDNFDPNKYDPKTIQYHAAQYDKKNFQRKIKEFVEEKHKGFNGSNGEKGRNGK